MYHQQVEDFLFLCVGIGNMVKCRQILTKIFQINYDDLVVHTRKLEQPNSWQRITCLLRIIFLL